MSERSLLMLWLCRPTFLTPPAELFDVFLCFVRFCNFFDVFLVRFLSLMLYFNNDRLCLRINIPKYKIDLSIQKAFPYLGLDPKTGRPIILKHKEKQLQI